LAPRGGNAGYLLGDADGRGRWNSGDLKRCAANEDRGLILNVYVGYEVIVPADLRSRTSGIQRNVMADVANRAVTAIVIMGMSGGGELNAEEGGDYTNDEGGSKEREPKPAFVRGFHSVSFQCNEFLDNWIEEVSDLSRSVCISDLEGLDRCRLGT
jgi:hypothetical protein